ncbi:MAG: hypothetical protein AAF483_28930, partial [Planctomycetota bacterium]
QAADGILRAIQSQQLRIDIGIFTGLAFISPFLAPFLVIMVCSAMLIGHERQTGTWEWTGSLPVTWQQALFSKLFITYLFGFCSGALLLPGACFAIQNIDSGPPTLMDFIYVWLGVMLLVGFFSTLVYFILLLLLNEPMYALVLGLMANIIIPYGVMMLVAAMHGFNTGFQIMDGIIVWSLLTIAAFIALLPIYRSVWIHPRQDLFRPARYQSISAAESRVAAVRREGQPSEAWAMLRLGLQSSVAIRAILLLALIGSYIASSPGEHRGLPWFLAFTASLLGATTFMHPSQLSRIRFLTDRGAKILPLLLQYIGLSFAWLLGISIVYVVTFFVSRPNEYAMDGLTQNLWQVVHVVFSFFLIGVLCSIICEKPIVALTCSVVLSMLAPLGFIFLWETGSERLFETGLILSVFVSTPILIAAILWHGKRWMVLLDPRPALTASVALALAVAIPISLPIILSFTSTAISLST